MNRGSMNSGPVNRRPATEREVLVPIGTIDLRAILGLPENPIGAVVFAHGSGSGRLSPRNNAVARDLQGDGLATILVDHLTDEEGLDRRNVFDVGLLAERLLGVTAWLRANRDTVDLPIGYFGASTGGGAALVAAAIDETVRAVVSRGGRPDLADGYLGRVQCPVLLIVGGADTAVVSLNQDALTQLQGVKELAIVPGATHLFEETGALEQVARLAGDWFRRYLPGR